MASLESLEKLLTDMKESFEREMDEGFADIRARMDHMNAHLEHIGGLVNGGGRAMAKMIDWTENTDLLLADLLRRQRALEKRIQKLEQKSNGKA